MIHQLEKEIFENNLTVWRESFPGSFKIILKFNIIFFSLQPEIEEWSSWDEDTPTSIKIEGGNGNVPPSPSEENDEPDYFKDMAPTIRKTQKVCLSLCYK